MIDTGLYAAIRKCKNQKMSMRQTAENLCISRNTVKRYWEGAHTPDERIAYPESVQSEMKLEIMAALGRYFEENREFSSGKQAINAKTAWEELSKTYTVGESTVRRYVQELKGKNPKAFIPLSFEPGEVMQVDWCEVKVCLQGHIWKVPVFCAVLPYSYTIFAMVLPDMRTPSFVWGHVKAFEAFGGVPQRVFYDNLKTAVFSGSGANAVKQERFLMLEAHYAFEAVFMNAAAGNEKGSVENLCGLIRQVAFTPIPKGEDLEKIQEQATIRCLNYNRIHKIKDRKYSIAEMSEQERPCLAPLPVKPYEAHIIKEAVVGSDLTFRYEGTKYSLPQEYVGKTVSIRIYPYRIDAWFKGSMACSHKRAFIKGEDQYLPEHYLSLLEQRPRSVSNATPLKYGVMPPELKRFRDGCMEKDNYAQLAQILLLGRTVDASLLLKAVDYANKTGLPTLQKVQTYLSLTDAAAQAAINDTVTVKRQELSDYDALLHREEAQHEPK